MSNSIKFGTGGWRAVIGEDFSRENVRRIAAGVAMLMKAQNKLDKPVVIGYDRRFLSDNAARWFAEVLSAYNIQVYFLKRSAPTPLIMHTVKHKHLHYGIEITASHNPACYNGIKLIIEEGKDADIETTELLERFIEQVDSPKHLEFNQAISKHMIKYINNPFNDYMNYPD